MAHAVLALLTSHSRFEAILSGAQEAAERASALASYQSIAITSLLPAVELLSGSQSAKEVGDLHLHMPVALLSQYLPDSRNTCSL